MNFDLVVIGGGPAGVSAATGAGVIGKSVALIEKASVIGGAGINTGTIPSKTLRETSLILSGWRSRRLLGIDLSLRREATINDFMQHEKQVTANERQRAEKRLNLRGVKRFHGIGSFVDSNTIRVTDECNSEFIIKADKIIIATGSSPLRPEEFDFADERIHDSNEILELKSIPKKLIIIGAGVIGSEYACTFAALGVEVHLVDARDTLMPFLDHEISNCLQRSMSESGVQFHWKEKVENCDNSSSDEIILTLSSGTKLKADGVLVCAGRSSNTDSLNLKAAGLTPGKRGLIQVDSHFRTTEISNIYAVGDVIGAPALASTAIEQARIAVCHAFNETFLTDIPQLLPTGIYTIPETSFVGETEAALNEKKIPYIVGCINYSEIPRGEIIGDRTGFLKLIFEKESMKLLGVHVIGEQATEVVHIGLIGMLTKASAELFTQICFNYPTLGDLYKYAAFDAILRKRNLK